MSVIQMVNTFAMAAGVPLSPLKPDGSLQQRVQRNLKQVKKEDKE